jgi:hypothetical protein
LSPHPLQTAQSLYPAALRKKREKRKNRLKNPALIGGYAAALKVECGALGLILETTLIYVG